jgi:hypothetical protein
MAPPNTPVSRGLAMVTPMADTIFDEEGAGRHVGGEAKPISPRTFQRWRQQGLGPRFCRVGNQIRYRQRDLDEWLSGRVAQSTADPIEVTRTTAGESQTAKLTSATVKCRKVRPE